MESAAIHSSEVHEVDSGIPMTLFKGFSTSLSLLQGELHLSHQASLPSGTRGCNRPPVLRTATLKGWRSIKGLRQFLRDGTAWE